MTEIGFECIIGQGFSVNAATALSGEARHAVGAINCMEVTIVTKAELANDVAMAVEGLTKKKAAEVVDAVFASIQNTLAKGGKIQAVGFGTFEVQHRPARKGRNPQNPNEVIDIPAKNVPAFRAGKALKDAVNSK